MPVVWPSDQAKDMAYRPTIWYLTAKTPGGAATTSGITRPTPIAGGSPAHIAQGQDSLSLLLAWTLLWPSLQSIVTRDSLNETFLGIAKGDSSAVRIQIRLGIAERVISPS